MGPLPLLLLFGRCIGCRPEGGVPTPQDGPQGAGRAQSSAQSPQLAARRPVREMCLLCVCPALRKRMAPLSFCVFPGRREGLGRGGGFVDLSEVLYLETRVLHDRTGLLFCTVCVCVFFPSKSFTLLPMLNSPSSPPLLFLMLG